MNRRPPFLISGFGRSGSHYLSRLLCTAGIDAPHENIGNDGSVSWKHIQPGRFDYLGKNESVDIVDPGFFRVVHLVREPLGVISSSLTFSESSWYYMEKVLQLSPEAAACTSDRHAVAPHPSGPKPGLIRRCFERRPLFHLRDPRDRAALLRRSMRCWLGWNQLIEAKAHWRLRVEDNAERWGELLEQIEKPQTPRPALPESARDSRHRRRGYSAVRWYDLESADPALAEQVRVSASRFGYPCRD